MPPIHVPIFHNFAEIRAKVWHLVTCMLLPPSLYMQLPALPNGVITNYTIQYRIKDSDSPWTEDVVPSSNTSHTLISLQSRTSYEIRVAAATSVGMGPYSEVVTVTVQDPGGLRGWVNLLSGR